MKKSCDDIQEILVDYADGQLSPVKANEVACHIAECESCRKLFEALQKSLELATVVWEDGLKETEAIKVPSRPKVDRIVWLRYAAVAASILIVAATSILWVSFNKPKEKENTLTFEEIEKSINDSAIAARLLAATELLAGYPDAADIVNRQYSYILETYPHTTAAEKIRLKP